MTAPDVVSGGGDRDPAPAWVRHAVVAVVVVLLAAVGLSRWRDAQERRAARDRAADRVDLTIAVTDVAFGFESTALVTVKVRGSGSRVRVDAPATLPREIATATWSGAPVSVGADEGNVIVLRLRPDCGRTRDVTSVALEVPVTPASGRRHLIRIAAPGLAEALHRVCDGGLVGG
jgi:hypothetical protein